MIESNGPYPGTVMSVNDPDKACRVKASIPALFFDVDTNEQVLSPWIEAMTGAGGGLGIVNVPPVGSKIYVFIEYSTDMSVYRMCYTGGHAMRTPGVDNSTTIPDSAKEVDDESVYLKPGANELGGQDLAYIPSPATRLAESTRRSGWYDHVVLESAVLQALPPSGNVSVYPYNHVLKTPGGILCELDDTPGGRRIHLYHPSGSYLEIYNDGDWVEHKTSYREEVGGQRVQFTGAQKLEYVGDYISLKCGGKHLEQAAGNRIILANQFIAQGENNMVLNSGGRLCLTSDGKAKIEGADGLEIHSGNHLTITAFSGIESTSFGPANYHYASHLTANFYGASAITGLQVPVSVPTTDVIRAMFASTISRSSVTLTGSHLNLVTTPSLLAGGVLPFAPTPEGFIVRSSAVIPGAPGGATTFCLDSNPTPSQALVGAAHYQLLCTHLVAYSTAELFAVPAAIDAAILAVLTAAALPPPAPTHLPALVGTTPAQIAALVAAATAAMVPVWSVPMAVFDAAMAALMAGSLAPIPFGAVTTALRSQ